MLTLADVEPARAVARCAARRRGTRELGTDLVQRAEEAPAAKRLHGDDGRGPAVLDRPCDLSRRREAADADGDGADLADGEGGHEPFRPVGEKDGDAVAFADTDRQQGTSEIVCVRHLPHSGKVHPEGLPVVNVWPLASALLTSCAWQRTGRPGRRLSSEVAPWR
jgi:hypothetical protein